MARHHLLGIGACALVVLAAAVPGPGGALPDDPLAMLGRSPEQVVEVYGVPEEAIASVHALTFRYRDPRGRGHDFVFHGDVAIQVPGAGFQPAKVRRRPADRAWPGQRVDEAVLRLGNPSSLTLGTATATLEYEDGSAVVVCQGRVFPR